MKLRYHVFFLFSLLATSLFGQVDQIEISRVELMPDAPSPYNLRDWKSIALGYDDFVFDVDKSGEFLPLIFVKPSGQNYPQNPSFGLHSYVGTFSPGNGEAINVLPALIGATLNGIDKSNQNGMNWVLMSQDFFNKQNGQLIYLNGPSTGTGNDWWYETMPSVFFYQLYDLYGEMGDAAFQFTSVADRFLAAARAMGGSDTPWNSAFMDYRAWDFETMTPNASGVHEPEAAGAFAWLLYHAYKQTGDPEYLKGAEWSIEFLEGWETNPSYELQLPYGVYVAAKMNAEIGTDYDIEKFVNWVFSRGPIRGWGTIVGNWGGVDVSGLVGEANDNGNDYAFQLNGVQQAATMVPMVRYDKRFARAVGKWMLNLANATRLMYPGNLPAVMQDASNWSQENDPNGFIGYEALREKFNGFSPFSTGDAVGGGWAETNLALYGSSSIGYLGSLIEETDVDKILKIDLLKTDFFKDASYPSYLLYNPYEVQKTVMINVGMTPVRIYDAISEVFLKFSASGDIAIDIGPDKVVSLVLAPAAGMVSFDENKMLIDGVVVDYNQTTTEYDRQPRIQALAAVSTDVVMGDTTAIYATATDRETDSLMYLWNISGGSVVGEGKTLQWIAPQFIDTFEIFLVVMDDDGNSDTAELKLRSVVELNIPPEILELTAEKKFLSPGEAIEIRCVAIDQNQDSISYEWNAEGGNISGSGEIITWTSPQNEGEFIISVRVADEEGAFVTDQVSILVYDFPTTSGNLIAYYPFNGNALDESGNALHGDVSGAKLTEDRLGNANSAYFFDGANDHISVTNDDILNVTKAISISCWVRPLALTSSEAFIISHGSWQNRWKISIIPERKIRWTIKNSVGAIRDLDSDIALDVDSTYHVTTSYDGNRMLIYVNGRLETFTTMSGDINPVDIDMEIAQMLPGVQTYNFRGILDEIRIYDYALHPDTISMLAGNTTTGIKNISLDRCLELFPNPVSAVFTIQTCDSENPSNSDIRGVEIIDQAGRTIRKIQSPGLSQVRSNVSGLEPGIYFVKVNTDTGSQVMRFFKLE